MALSPNTILSPEKRLLVCCARTRMNSAIADEIRELVARPLDWNVVLSEAADNCVTPLLAKQLAAVAGDIIPADVLAALKDGARANAVRCLIFIAELIKIMDAFSAAGIEAIAYKGPVIAAQAYGDVTLREFEDLDIVLLQRDMAKANEIATGLGYRARFPWILSGDAGKSLVPGEYNYLNEARRIMIELHTEVTLRHFPEPPDLDDLRTRLTPVSLSGHVVNTFAPEDMLPILCIHGSKDFWMKFSWIADVAEFIQALPGLDWNTVVARADAWRAGRMLHLGLALADDLLDVPLPEEVLTRVRKDHVALAVAAEIGRVHLTRAPLPESAGWRFRYRRRMVKGNLTGWRYALRLATAPAEEDWEMLRLPAPLAPLYVVLRPFRLLRKYRVARTTS